MALLAGQIQIRFSFLTLKSSTGEALFRFEAFRRFVTIKGFEVRVTGEKDGVGDVAVDVVIIPLFEPLLIVKDCRR